MQLPIPNIVSFSIVTQWLQELSPETKQSLIEQAEFPADDKPYGRKIVYQDERLEIILTAWRPGNVCLPHDHGNSSGAVFVLRGSLKNTFHHPTILTPTRTQTVNEEKILSIPKGTIHSVMSGTQGELIGLHVYWPAIDSMFVYDREAGKKWQVKNTAGAWHPAPEDILSETNL